MLIQLENINFSYSGGATLLANTSLTLEEKKVYALMGANGSGKTTLFNLLTGFIKPLRGEIIFRNDKITGLSPFKISRKGICRTFQDLRLISKLTVKENIVLAMQNNPTDHWVKALLPGSVYKNELDKLGKEADDIIENYFLQEVKNNLAGEISYGQQKLLNLACCVANGASLLLLDEPVAGIQPDYRNKIAVLIKQMKDQGKTILLIEHNPDFINDVADQIFFLNEGRISSFDNIESLRSDKIVMEAYL